MQCQICRSNRTKIIRTKLRHNIRRKVYSCADCRHAFLDPHKTANKKFYVKENYRSSYGPAVGKTSNCQQIFDTYFPFQGPIIKEINRILKPSLKVLDVGCSTGHFLQALKGKVKERVGLELQEESVVFIRKNLNFKVYAQPIEEAEIVEAPFDLVTCLQVLEHVENPLGFLKNIAKNLKPGGYLYLEVPNINNALLSCYKVKGYTDFYFCQPHLSYFSMSSLKILLHQAGFNGTFKTVQRYNIINHLNWMLTNALQADFTVGNSNPVLVTQNDVKPAIKRDLNNFIRSVNENYKQLLIKHNIGESITFLGKKICS